MIITNPELDMSIECTGNAIASVVIENRDYFRRFTMDIYSQISGNLGLSVLSDNDRQLDFSKHSEITDSFISFTLNRKSLQTKIVSAMERRAMEGDMYLETAEILTSIEKYVDTLAEFFIGNISCNKVNIVSLLKAVGICIADDYDSPLERIIDYMELTREYDRDKLFIFVNMRSYFNDDDMNMFSDTVISHDLKVLLIDNYSYNYLSHEKRITIDEDLCEF